MYICTYRTGIRLALPATCLVDIKLGFRLASLATCLVSFTRCLPHGRYRILYTLDISFRSLPSYIHLVEQYRNSRNSVPRPAISAASFLYSIPYRTCGPILSFNHPLSEVFTLSRGSSPRPSLQHWVKRSDVPFQTHPFPAGSNLHLGPAKP